MKPLPLRGRGRGALAPRVRVPRLLRTCRVPLRTCTVPRCRSVVCVPNTLTLAATRLDLSREAGEVIVTGPSSWHSSCWPPPAHAAEKALRLRRRQPGDARDAGRRRQQSRLPLGAAGRVPVVGTPGAATRAVARIATATRRARCTAWRRAIRCSMASSAGRSRWQQRINQCRTERQGAAKLAPDSDAMLALTAYVGLQSRGLPVQVSIDGPARPFFEAGQALFTHAPGPAQPVMRPVP